MFRFLLHPIALAVLVTLLIWFGIIVYWQQTVRLVTAQDVGIYLVGLPVAVIALGFGLRTIFRRSNNAEPKAEPAAPAAASAPATDESERTFNLALLSVGVASAAGDSAATTYQAVTAGQVQPVPDRDLRNRDGFPVHACRTQQLDTQEIESALAALGATSCTAEMLRALTLLKQSLAPVLEVLGAAAPGPDKQPAAASAARLPRLAVDLLLPAGWEEHRRELAGRYVGGLIVETGWPAAVTSLNVLAADEGTLALRQLDGFSLRANRNGSADFYLLAGCESAIDEDVVSALESSGRLFSSTNGQGRIPGEAAMAMLAQAPAAVAKSLVPVAQIGRVALAVRDKSADAAGRIGHETLLEIAQHGLAGAQIPADDVGLVVSDADQRSSRCSECLGALNSLLPELDPAKGLINAGQALGRLSGAGTLVALGISAAAVEAEEKPVLLMAVSHATERAAVVLQPYVEPAAGAPAAA